MKTIVIVLILGIALAISAQTPPRFVAVTIDDLPVVVKNSDLGKRQKITKKLLTHITKAKAPAIGFVNENKLYRDGEIAETEVELLSKWLDAGLELGNHSFSHKSLHAIPLDEYIADILKGEVVTKRLLEQNGMKMRYFRHPFLHTGLKLEIKQGLNDFLERNNYTIAPVSIDNSDWAFSRAYDNSIEKNDKSLRKRIGKAYVPYLEAKTVYWERQSVKLFGREIKQTLLLHSNSINADYFDDLMKMYKQRGYKFIALDEALKDKAYRLPDTFTGRAGISWLHRWALAKGKGNLVPDEPRVPKFVMEAAGLESE
ncbi:MAG: polysaccharide deacetylase family protein [Pyrinomonadaceae bacterium]|nr:polysaccharide deacetylase family protein [Pyrinomonadaceae bacterium]